MSYDRPLVPSPPPRVPHGRRARLPLVLTLWEGTVTREDAEQWASWHRDEFGDDVVLHDPEDQGDAFVCEDCGWTEPYVPERGAS